MSELEGCDIIVVCNGDTTIFVQDAGKTRGQSIGADIVSHVIPLRWRSGERKILKKSVKLTESGVSERNMKFINFMEENVFVAERVTSLFLQLTTNSVEETKSGANIIVKLGN